MSKLQRSLYQVPPSQQRRLAAALLLGIVQGANAATAPPVVDTEPPTNITIYDVNSNAVVAPLIFSAPRPVITLKMTTEVASSIVATDSTQAGSPSSDTPGYPTGTLGPMAPGRHTITWTATDLGNNSLSVPQYIDILPEVSFGVDQTVGEGTTIQVRVYLSGNAPSLSDTPPTAVNIPFSINAGSTASDYTVVTPSPLQITAGTTASITIATGTGNSEGQFITLNMGSPSGAIAGNKISHTVTLTEANLAPIITLSAKQGGAATQSVTTGGGLVILTASAYDPNGDSVSNYDWSASDNTLVPTAGTTSNTFSFDPTGLTPGIYTTRLTVSDSNGATSTRDLLLRLYTTAPTLSATTDSDDDGSSDSVEGIEDDDGDGIPNYLDAVSNPAWLPGWDLLTYRADLKRSDSFVSGPITFSWVLDSVSSNRVYYPLLLATEPGLKLSIGPTAFASGSNHGRIDTTAASLLFGSTPPENLVSADGQVVDIEISGLGTTGQSVYLVIPQAAALPDVSNFKVMSAAHVWQDFVNEGAGGRNRLLFAAKESDSYCPKPAGSYTIVTAGSNALISGVSCIELLIQDGGPNDYDGKANGIIRLLGAPFVDAITNNGAVLTPPDFSGPAEGSVESINKITVTQGGGGVGFISLWGALGLLLAYAVRRRL